MQLGGHPTFHPLLFQLVLKTHPVVLEVKEAGVIGQSDHHLFKSLEQLDHLHHVSFLKLVELFISHVQADRLVHLPQNRPVVAQGALSLVFNLLEFYGF